MQVSKPQALMDVRIFRGLAGRRRGQGLFKTFDGKIGIALFVKVGFSQAQIVGLGLIGPGIFAAPIKNTVIQMPAYFLKSSASSVNTPINGKYK